MPGFLVPDHYQVVAPTLNDLLIASIIWGFTLATGMFSGHKAVKQTYAQWKRSGRAKPYVIMVWAEWLVSIIISVLSWCFLRGFIEPSFWIYFTFLALWVVQIQCICGIIINRISLLMVDRRDGAKIRWATAAILGLINISVFVIWIPAQLQISSTWINVNHIYDRIEKGLFLIIDAALHTYFMYLIRVKLIANGLDKYKPLLRFNFAMIAISMSLDVILIGSMSIGNGFIYVQFHPLVYMLKLHIELNISSLIVKVVRATGDNSSYQNDYYNQGTELQSKPMGGGTNGNGVSNKGRSGTNHGPLFSSTNEARIDTDGDGLGRVNMSRGITKITQTQVTVSARQMEDDDGSSQSSTRQLKGAGNMYRDPFP
ncbi:hypothetical protein CEP54_014234 [Fusarium duplospermum]|uniref:Uncharacterized protein n=1 Tax=Fusarium duplospermum TaxID=1325734 RepID=A0A428NXF2_9HYPO|nr:hypothetical protein CEP54_014234 [Fusarium duplospermum]